MRAVGKAGLRLVARVVLSAVASVGIAAVLLVWWMLSARSTCVIVRDAATGPVRADAPPAERILAPHRVVFGDRTVVGIRTFDFGPTFATDARHFEKVTIVLRPESQLLGEVRLDDGKTDAILSRGSPDWIGSGAGLVGHATRGTVELRGRTVVLLTCPWA